MFSVSAAQNSAFNEKVAYFLTFKNDQISVIVDIHISYSISNIFSNFGDIAKIHIPYNGYFLRLEIFAIWAPKCSILIFAFLIFAIPFNREK